MKGQTLYLKAKRLIPGGTQLLSKRPERYLPELWPSYFSKAEGCKVWDLDGNEYIDMSNMSVGACILGYSDEDVNNAVCEAINKGNMCTLNAPEEVELAKLLLELHPWAAMVRFARTGGEAMAIAVRIGRAKTGKDKVLFCGYHGWHDWYLAANLADSKALDGHLLPGLKPLGVPRVLKGTAIPFKYNSIEEFLKKIKKYKDEVGVVIVETLRNFYPENNFLHVIREVTKDLEIVLIFDEITSGWRLTIGGAHLIFGVEPDIAVFGKAISNGFPMSAVIGKKEVMEIAQETFISSTYWTDRIGPVAAITTIKKIKEKNVPEYIQKIGKKIQEGWKQSAQKYGLNISVTGIYPLSHFNFDYDNSLVLKTLFTQLMLKKKFLANTSFYASYSHKKEHIEKYLNVMDEVFYFISKVIKENNPEKYLKGPVCQTGFKRLT